MKYAFHVYDRGDRKTARILRTDLLRLKPEKEIDPVEFYQRTGLIYVNLHKKRKRDGRKDE